MSSIHKDGNKPHWFCCFYDPEGFRRKRSTGTGNKRVATTICVNVERAAEVARQGKLSNEKGLRLIRETCLAIEETHGKLAANRAHDILKGFVEEFVKIAGGELTTYTVRSWLNSWLAGRTDASRATVVTYRGVLDMFLKYLGARADRPLTTLQPKQVEDFKQRLNGKVAPSTVNRAIKVLKASFNNAVAKRQLEFSPAEHIEAIEVEETTRRPFTDAELKQLLAVADAEWRTMIFIAFYTGLRLADCANLTWREVDVQASNINLVTEKTKRRQILPIAPPLNRHLLTLAGDIPDAPLCPTLRGKPSSWLSGQFYNLMAKAKLVEARAGGKESTGKGRDVKRDTNRISFHSLRYNTTSALKSVGVSEAVAMDIVGHDTAAMSRSYTKIADDTKRAAMNKLPDIAK